MSAHVHEVRSMPQTGTGYGVCECGATLRIENWKPNGAWHSCALCVVVAPK